MKKTLLLCFSSERFKRSEEKKPIHHSAQHPALPTVVPELLSLPLSTLPSGISEPQLLPQASILSSTIVAAGYAGGVGIISCGWCPFCRCNIVMWRSLLVLASCAFCKCGGGVTVHGWFP